MSQDCECEQQTCPDGAPGWIMTFSDLMSLLLAFFVLLFSFSEIDKQKYKQLSGSMKNAFGVQREIKAEDAPVGNNIIAREFSPGRPTPTPLNIVRQMTMDNLHRFPRIYDAQKKSKQTQERETGSKADNGKNIKQPSVTKSGSGNEYSLSKEKLERIKRVEHDSKVIRKELSKEIKKGLIELEVKDEQIILRVREKGSFPSGSAKIIKPFKLVANKIADVFNDFNGEIIVSGHTDNLPIHTDRFRSNWELSASRAVSVIEVLQKQPKLKNKHFELEAFADTKPLVSNKTWKGRAKNRRVEIELSYEHMPINNNTSKKQLKQTKKKQKKLTGSVQQKKASVKIAEKLKIEKTPVSSIVNKVDKNAKK